MKHRLSHSEFSHATRVNSGIEVNSSVIQVSPSAGRVFANKGMIIQCLNAASHIDNISLAVSTQAGFGLLNLPL